MYPPVIKMEGKIAKPSKPSVKLTALDEPTMTNIPNKIKNMIEISKIKSLLKGRMKYKLSPSDRYK